jgi:hypothetical protein
MSLTGDWTRKCGLYITTPVAHTCDISYSGGKDQEDHSLRPGKIVHKTQSQKHLTQNRADRVAQVIECLLSK